MLDMTSGPPSHILMWMQPFLPHRHSPLLAPSSPNRQLEFSEDALRELHELLRKYFEEGQFRIICTIQYCVVGCPFQICSTKRVNFRFSTEQTPLTTVSSKGETFQVKSRHDLLCDFVQHALQEDTNFENSDQRDNGFPQTFH